MRPWVLGIDVGARYTRALVLDGDGAPSGRGLVESGAFFARAAEEAAQSALREAGLERTDLSYAASTGYGRSQVPWRDLQVTELTCHAAGALRLFPRTRTVIDVGAQNTRVMAISPEGRVTRFMMNDKCAAGAGRFLERCSAALEVPLGQLGARALTAREPQPISSICAVLAESEVINLVSQELPVEEILLGVHHSICDRVMTIVHQTGFEPEITLTGGMVHNPAMIHVLGERLGTRLNSLPEGEYAGALGAALLGRRRLDKRISEGSGAPAPASEARGREREGS
jgi:predicted CoA-substrate-specific enzyme activase